MNQELVKGDPYLLRYLPPPESTSKRIESPKFYGGCIAVLRNEPIDAVEYGAVYRVDTGLGIAVLTDSNDLADQIGRTKRDPVSEVNTELIYITKRPFDPTGTELPPRAISRNQPGDLLVNPSLKSYAVAGPEKYGSLISLVYGIYSFERAENNMLGLHASMVYDKIQDRGHIFIGESGIGKSTYAQLLVGSNPDRFSQPCDDWLEIDIQKNIATPISSTFGVRSEQHASEHLNIASQFQSHGKEFLVPSKAIQTQVRIGKVFQLQSSAFEPTYSEVFDIFREVDHHIPFLGRLHMDLRSLPRNITNRLFLLINNYSLLIHHQGFQFLNARLGDQNKVLNQIIKSIA